MRQRDQLKAPAAQAELVAARVRQVQAELGEEPAPVGVGLRPDLRNI